jgi:hypothetical protein
MGRMFKQLGVLQSDEVVCCSPADFTTGYAGGQAAKQTQSILQKALGKTLFIDEAYGTLLLILTPWRHPFSDCHVRCHTT